MTPSDAQRNEPNDSHSVSLGILSNVLNFYLRRIHNHSSRPLLLPPSTTPLPPGLFSALALIQANPGLSQAELARQIGVDKAVTSGLLNQMVLRGWAERRPDAGDRRKYHLATTEAGDQALEALCVLSQAQEAPIRAALSAAERAEVIRLLDKIYTHGFSRGRR